MATGLMGRRAERAYLLFLMGRGTRESGLTIRGMAMESLYGRLTVAILGLGKKICSMDKAF